MKFGASFALFGAVTMIVAGCGSSTPSMKGSQVLARVRAAYRHVPAVKIVGSDPPGYHDYWTDVLRDGILTAEHAVELYPHNRGLAPSLVFAYANGRTYNFQPKTKCWVVNSNYWPLRGSDYRMPFPHETVIQGASARRVGGEWQLPIVSQVGPSDTLFIDAKTFLVEKRVLGDAHNYVERYVTLTRAPVFPTPRPLCHK